MTLEIRLLLIAAAVAALLFGFNRFIAGQQQIGADRAQAAQLKADSAERDRRDAAMVEVNNDAQRWQNRRVDDTRSLDGAAARLRDRATAAIGQECRPAPVAASAPADAPPGVCAELLAKADERLRLLAATADASYDAGKACERAYDSLTNEVTKR